MLEMLGSKDWHVTIKEGAMRPLMVNLHIAMGDAKSCGNASALDMAEKWIHGTQAVKDTLAKHRYFARAGKKGRSEKYVALNEVMKPAVTFRDEVGGSVGERIGKGVGWVVGCGVGGGGPPEVRCQS